MNAVSWDVKDMLEAWDGTASSEADLELVYGTNLFTGLQPANPYNVVTILDIPGGMPWLGLTDKGYEYPSIQILVRNKDYNEGMNLCERIKDALHGRAQETWNDTLYTLVRCSTPPALLEWDDNGCANLFMNFNLQRRVA